MSKIKAYTFNDGYMLLERLLGYTRCEVETFLLNSNLMWYSKKRDACYPYSKYCKSLDDDDNVCKHKYFYVKTNGSVCEYGFTNVGIKYVYDNIERKHFL